MKQQLSDPELFWLVGILEGEGYFGYEKWSQRIQVKMTDLDTIQKVTDVFEKATGRRAAIHESPNKTVNENLPYVVAIHGEDARIVMRLVVPHMGFRRRKRIWQALNGHKPRNLKLDTKALVASIGLRKEPAMVIPGAVTYINAFVKRRA